MWCKVVVQENARGRAGWAQDGQFRVVAPDRASLKRAWDLHPACSSTHRLFVFVFAYLSASETGIYPD